MPVSPRILLIDPVESSREALSERLRTLGYEVVTGNDGAQGAYAALEKPPRAVIADLFMPSISGVQLCRLLGAEPATSEVPVILRGPEVHRDRFWAEQAGALAYVAKGRMGDLVRALQRGIEQSASGNSFFTAYASGTDVRDRIAHYLDAALFTSVVASEVRKLASCESFDTLFDLFAQFVSQITNYRWLSVMVDSPARACLHTRPGQTDRAKKEALEALNAPDSTPLNVIEDDDASADETGPNPLVREILFGDKKLGTLALAPRESSEDKDIELIDILARELGGALRTATLVEESRMLACSDPLTLLFNRRAFSEAAAIELAAAKENGIPLSILLLDVDHFKAVNDTHGHALGDLVLQKMGRLIESTSRENDVRARWGGEEFVILMPATDEGGAVEVAEKIRLAVEDLEVPISENELLRVTASVGVSTLKYDDSLEGFLERADRAMYLAKTNGRNRVCRNDSESIPPNSILGRPQPLASQTVSAPSSTALPTTRTKQLTPVAESIASQAPAPRCLNSVAP